MIAHLDLCPEAASDPGSATQARCPVLVVSCLPWDLSSPRDLTDTVLIGPEPSVGPSKLHFLEAPEGEESPTFLLGRAEECDVSLPYSTISRQHARISCEGGQYFITDLGSKNGTIVNAVPLRVGEKQLLEHEALVMLGDLELEFRLPPVRSL